MSKDEAIQLTNSAYFDVERGDLINGRAKLETALKLADDIPDTHNEYATILASLGEFEKARQHIERAINLSPNEPKFWACLSKWYFDRQDFSEALNTILVAEKLDPSYPTIEVAKMRISRAMGATPDVIRAHQENASKLYEMRGRRADGTPFRSGDLNRILSTDSDTTVFESKRVNTNDFAWSIKYLPIPSDPEANRLFEQAMDAEGGIGKMSFWLLCRGLVGASPYNQALILYTKSLEKEPICPKVHTAFGILLARIGRKQEALQHFLKANKLHPKNAWIEANLSLCYYELSDFDSASRFLLLAQSHKKP